MHITKTFKFAHEFRHYFNHDLNCYIDKLMMIAFRGEFFFDIIKFEKDLLSHDDRYDTETMSVREGVEKIYGKEAADFIERLINL